MSQLLYPTELQDFFLAFYIYNKDNIQISDIVLYTDKI